MATAQGPAIWFWVDGGGGGGAPTVVRSRLPILGVGVLTAWFVPVAAILSVGLLG